MATTAPLSASADVKADANDNDLSKSDIVTKYRTASSIANLALQKVIAGIKTGVSVKSLCKLGDDTVLEEVAKVYNKKENGRKIEKGIAFPTCLSLNELCAYFSPLEDTVVINDGDTVKISVGCHVDGYVGVVTHTVVNAEAITGRAADVLTAAWTCCEAAIREIRVGNNSHNVSKVVEKVAAEFKCTPVLGVTNHEIKRHIIEGSRYFANGTRPEEKCEPFTFGVNEAYAVNIMVSTGEGKPKVTEHKTTIYKAEVQNRYTLKTTLGRAFISQVNARFPAFPFRIDAFEDERVLKAGLPEAVRHKLVTPYLVGTEKSGEIIAHFMFVVLILAGGTKKIGGIPFAQKEICKSEHTVEDEELKKLLASPVNPKAKKASKQSAEEEATAEA
ncbi:protease family m24 methionyl aminopeptidase [Babesia gibsoni]|uniref:Protease family m24 methionyl aminopeptidase n=1 Tax=Babesia gibsoni TaxID=33632 RepID=A0AAD8PDA1_BABGI|nr:protease family m24 methionyl aminopeptidase [Babesia gibsoni]